MLALITEDQLSDQLVLVEHANLILVAEVINTVDVFHEERTNLFHPTIQNRRYGYLLVDLGWLVPAERQPDGYQ